MQVFGVIMAGGGGTRFWPLSRKQTPKQLLNLSGKDVMVNETFSRLARVAEDKNIFVVTNKSQADKLIKVSDGRLLPENVLREPAARNTAACIGYAAVKIAKTYKDGVMVITPSDAYIRDEEKFAEILKTAAKAAETSDDLITVGITPTFPATGYGYIRYRKANGEIKDVEQFVEKPDLKTAEAYVASGNYVWNSGMFVWKASAILKKFKELLPDIYEDLQKIYAAVGTEKEREVIEEVYPSIKSISVDYGIMERAGNIKVIPAEFGWNDVGSWDMLNVLHKSDNDGNVKVGDALTIDVKDSTVYSSGRLIAVVGVDNLVVVETPDAVLVCPKDRAQDVKKIVDALKEGGREELL